MLYKRVDYSLSKLLHDIEHGDIALPDLQRPFVWPAAKVRDLFDSMYRGFPVGYFLFWANEHLTDIKQIGVEQKQAKVPRLLIVDGQQRLTSLFAVLKGKRVLNKDFKETSIKISFRPIDSQFDVADAAIERDPEYIYDISELWKQGTSSFRFINKFIEKLRNHREITDEEENVISDNIDRLYKLQEYQFTAMEISSTVDEEQVSDIFVRINSQGKKLNQADFILTLLSVFWDQGRKELEAFSRESREARGEQASPFNHFIHPDPAQMLRVAVGLGFKRARLKNVYTILRGKDLETGEVSSLRRDQQFDVLKQAQQKVLNLQNWHDFLKVLIKAGFRSKAMVSSDMSIIYSYVIYLIGKEDFHVDAYRLRKMIAKWYFMLVLTGRYTGSPETVMEADLARLRGVADQDEFVGTLEKIIADSLTNDFWTITLVNKLESSTSRNPALHAYYAALNILDANVLFSNMKVSELLDPVLRANRNAIEKHHLFPKKYLKSIGINEDKLINQVANLALVEWGDNARISDESPESYFPRYAERFTPAELAEMMEYHALPDNWTSLDYPVFLEERRKKMAQIIKAGYIRL
ncbi:GmrSD restriction endonuclease domain-containing protein [Laceyella putida]|uniref:DUF262 domain-containing protein n=1 Tax=Laceyella putida TaxID=110101 RepID=A0ABW2RQ75_9BACL